MRAVGPKGVLHSRYELVRELGEGSFGTVFEAVETQTGRRLALKELVRVSPSALARFKHEFRALQDLHHPNLVDVKELFEHQGRWFIAMELLEGEDLLSWVRSPNPAANQNGLGFNEQRLRAAFGEVARGLLALHEHGILHRDLKPENVRVEPSGRAVLLDFGLVTALDPGVQSTQGGGIGTAAYMAPEQAAGAKTGPEADWYALGVCLYEALTGERPFRSDNPLQILLLKQGNLPPPPSSVVKGLPQDLEELCMRLLEPLPGQRPTREQIWAALDIADDSSLLEQSMTMQVQGLSFAGREGELEQLERAYERTHEGALSVLLIEGESGVGKSALVDEFLRQHRERHPDTWVLKGRCYENEQVPYKAFDGCIDALAKTLKHIPNHELEGALPPRAAVLGQLFPVLRELKALARAPMHELSADPTARRLEAFAALSALLNKLCEVRPVVLVIDDLQWADAESFRMLRALVDDRHPAPVLILCTVRPRSELESEVAQQLEVVRNWRVSDVLSLHGLPRAQARDLVTQLLGGNAPAEWMRVIVDESRGHPLFINTLVQYAASHDIGTTGSLTLEAALSARVNELGNDARALLELVALAGRPCGEQVFARALGDAHGVAQARRLLLSRKLIRARRNDELVCFHDRMRSVVASSIGTARLPALHLTLALALQEDPSCDESERARHWDAAGEHERASLAYERAAESALESLAFAQAAQFCERALALIDAENPRRPGLLVMRGDALARGARSAEAARCYQEASERAEGEARVRLRVASALHLLQGAHFEEGMRAVRSVLSDLGLALPVGTAPLLTRFVWQRALASIRGLDFKIKAAGDVPAAERLLLDALYALSFPVGWCDLIAGGLLNTVHLRRALALGESAHIARALAQEHTFRAMQAPNRSETEDDAGNKARALVADADDPALIAYQQLMEGTSLLMRSRYAAARQCLETAEHILQTRCPGEPWLLTNVRMSLGGALFYSSAHRRLRELSSVWIAQAEERCDRFALTALVGPGSGYLGHLMNDTPERALEHAQQVLAPWPTDAFSLAHFGNLIAMSQALLYRGDGQLHDWFEDNRARCDSAFLLKAGIGCEFLLTYRALAAIAKLAVSDAASHPTLLKQADKDVRALRRLKTPLSEGVACLIEAQLEAARGNTSSALTLARRASELLTERQVVYQHAAAYLEDRLLGLPETAPRSAAAIALLRQEGWLRPEQALKIWAPIARFLAQNAPAEAAPVPSKRLVHDRYEVIRSLGAGSFGSVVEAIDVMTGQRVALKELVRTSPGALLRFKHEFRALQEVYHPNLVRLDALFEHEGAWFIAMELVEGLDFVRWTRPLGVCDETRLRAAAGPLVRGLVALHEAGFLHRDLTPGNVRVTSDGRVALLDFGLMTALAETADSEGLPLGTFAYMAPEQFAGKELDSSADAYALGVCLFEAMTGTLPFEGPTPMHLAIAKRGGLPRSDPRIARHLNSELGALCLSLLATKPDERPPLRTVLEALELTSASPASTLSHAPPPLDSMFAGREAELVTLDDAFGRTQHGRAAIVLIDGQSGVGKTALVNEALRRIRRASPDTLVLRGRCYENEQVPYKAFDGAIDALAKALRKRGTASCERILPNKAALLAQVFPVLGSVSSISDATKRGLPAEPTARRLAALVALRELLTNLRKEQPLVIAVDDLQWADAESFRLLRALLEDEHAPALLMLFTIRPEVELQPEIAAYLDPLRKSERSHSLSLSGLSPAEARVLATKLTVSMPEISLDALVRESKGHPLFISELAHFAGHGKGQRREELTLESALAQRIQQLPVDARQLLELVALAGRPYGSHIFARALERSEGLGEAVSTLLANRLLRAGKNQILECFHDRIGLVTLGLMTAQAALAHKAALARALEAESNADPAELARLWDAVGDLPRAISAYERAADATLESLAFNQAERLYARAIELDAAHDKSRSDKLMVQRAHALARGGRSAEAARLYQEAATGAKGEAAIRLRLAAAQQLLQSTQFEEGLLASRDVLSELGVTLPSSTAGALTQLLWNRCRFSMRGLHVKTRVESEIPSKEKLTLDALLQLSMPVGWVLLLQGASLNARHLNLALSVGETGHVARALAQEAAFLAVQNPQANAHVPLLARSRELVTGRGDAALEGFQTFMEGTSAFFCFDNVRARELLESAHEQLQTRCPGEPWLLTNTRVTLGGTRAVLGEHARLAADSEAWLDEAREREDRFGLTLMFGLGRGYVRLLMRDNPEAALAEIDRIVAPWPEEPMSWAHFGQLWTVAESSLYVGGDGALQWFRARRAPLDAAIITRTALVSEVVAVLRAQSSLAALAHCTREVRATLLEELDQAPHAIRKRGLPQSDALARLIAAQRDAIAGKTEHALATVRPATLALTQGHAVHQHAARFLEGLLEGGEGGQEKRQATLTFFRDQGWQKPECALRVYGLGGLDALSVRYARP